MGIELKIDDVENSSDEESPTKVGRYKINLNKIKNGKADKFGDGDKSPGSKAK